jgi:hypothetical protein
MLQALTLCRQLSVHNFKVPHLGPSIIITASGCIYVVCCSVHGGSDKFDWESREPVENEEFYVAVEEAYGFNPSAPTADDVCWITPVQGKDFNYEDTFLAG